MKKLALFDFDGTITRKDTLLEFVKFTHGNVGFWIGMLILSPILILYKAGLLPNYKAKRIFLSWFFKDWSWEELKRSGDEFSLRRLPDLIRKSALEKIKWHKSQGHEVVIVSASSVVWFGKWSDQYGINSVGTELEFVNKKFTGCFSSENCFGIEKVNRVKKYLDVNQFDYIYAYGDSRGDREMLEIADEKFYKFFSE